MDRQLITTRPCSACGHTWPTHRRTSTGGCETCECPAYWDPQWGSLRGLTDRWLKNPASRQVRGSDRRDAGQP